MERANEQEKEFRHGDHGPKYLFRGPRIEWGIIVFKPGQELGPHKHAEVEETFYFLEGAPQMIVNEVTHRVQPGDAFRIEPGEAHNIINDTDSDTRLVFIKCPYIPDDKINL
jgi:quercetin dioxygenase-like cupin family protein